MPFDLDDITGTDPGKGQTSPGFDPSDIKAAAGTGTGASRQNLISGSIDPYTNFDDFRFQPKTNADNYMLRAQDQGFWESLGKTLGNVAANIPLDIIQGVGYLGTLTEVGDDRDYGNALTREIEKLKNPLGEVYLKHPDQTFDLTDSAWWLNNLGQLAESAASFAVEGAGIGKLFGTLAKSAAWSARAAKLGARAAQGLSAATLTYMEGAMSGAQVYDTAYNNNYMKLYQQGMDPADADLQAKHIASQAAAATVQLHTALNLGLNLTGLAPIFREPDQAIVSWWRKNGAPLPRETKAEWLTRISEAVPDGMPLKKLLGMGMEGPTRLGLEAFQEGLEEVNTQYAEHVGKAIGEGKEQKDVTGRLADLDRYFSEVLNQEGALNIALGALGGIAQTAIMDHIPVHKVVKYGPDGQPLLVDGKPQTERVSSHTMNDRMNRQYFDNIRDSLSKDMDWFSKKNQEMDTALKNKDLATLARVRADLLSVHNLRAISMGMGDVWKQQYQDIANLDNTRSLADDLDAPIEELSRQIEEDRGAGDMEGANQKSAQRYQLQQQQEALRGVTEASQKGFSEGATDNAYKTKAMQAIQNLDYLSDLYRDTQDKYTGTPEMEASGLADHMFYRQANQFLHKQQLDMMNEDLLKLKARVDALTLTDQEDILVGQAKDYLSDREVLDNTVKKLNQDIVRINDAIKNKNASVLSKMLEKYKIPSTPSAGADLVGSIERRKTDLEKRIKQVNYDLTDAIDLWRQNNPEGNVDDVLQKASQKPLLEDLYVQNKQYYQQALSEHQIAQEKLAEDSSNAGIRKYLRENKPEDIKKQQAKQHIEAYNQQMDREIAADMDAKQKQAAVQQMDQRITQLTTTIAEDQVKLREVQKALRNLKGFFRNFSKRLDLITDRQKYEQSIQTNTYELNILQQRRGAMAQTAATAAQQAQNVARNPAPVVQPIDAVTPGSTPAPNTTATPEAQPEQQEYSDTLPDFDFSQEVIPKFTTLQEGHVAFDTIMGGSEAGNTFRQFINLRKGSNMDFFLDAMEKMLKKVNLPIPTTEEINKFVYPYINALKEQYLTQKKDPGQLYEELKGFLKPDVLTILDILEGEFREHGFSYDRALQVLNQQVAAGNLQKNMVGPVVNQLKDYLEFVQEPVSTEPEHVPPTDAATPNIPATSVDLINSSEGTKALGRVLMEREIIRKGIITPEIEQLLKQRDKEIFNSIGDTESYNKIKHLLNQPVTVDVANQIYEALNRGKDSVNLSFDNDSHIFSDGDGIFEIHAKAKDGYKNVFRRSPATKKIDYMGARKVMADPAPLGPNAIIPDSKARELGISEKQERYITLNDLYNPQIRQLQGTITTTKEFNEEPTTYIPPTPDSEATIFSNSALDTDVVQQDMKRFVGAQNIEAVKANFNTHPYKEFDDGTEIRIVSTYTQLEPALNTDVLIPGKVTPGDEVIFEVDENWAGEINFDDEMVQNEYGEQLRHADSFQNYLEAPGRIGTTSTAAHPKGAHANVPIRIIQKSTGKTLGYLPRADWVIAKYPNTQNYRNVTDNYSDQGEEVTDNVARQYSRIIKLRENIVRAWNTNPQLKMTSKVSKRGTGHVMLNRDVNVNTGRTKLVNRSAKNMLPDTTLEIAIMKQGSAYVANGTLTSKQISSRLPGYMSDASSLPVVLLPSPDGTYMPAPLYTHRLGDNPSQLNTVVGAIELYLRAVAGQQRPTDSKALDKIRESTGFDISLASGLRDFIQQYFTYTQKFGEKDTVLTPSEVKVAMPEFMLDIPDEMPGEKAAFIKVGTSFSGEKPLYAQLVNGELHPDFEQALREGLQGRFKNVIFAGKQLRGINSTGEFSAPIIRKDGTVQVNKYSSYNEFVKANSTTYVYGLNKVGDQYVYMANPVVQIDYDAALRSAPPVVSTSIEDTPESPQDLGENPQEFEEPDELADLFGNGILSPSPGSVQSLQVPSEGEQVTLEFLEDLRNITPEAHRNSKTPEQVLRELLERGVTVLAEGHNPFYVC